MGYAITWCAVPEAHAEQFIQRLELTPTGETEDSPSGHLISTGRLDTGWHLLWYDEYGCPFLQPKDLEKISVDHDIILCLVEEHVMASSSELWSGGRRKWWISHNGDDGPKGLATDGELPDGFAAIRKEMEARQLAEGGETANVDYIFEIPLRVAEKLVEFKHDMRCDHFLGLMTVMSRPTSKSPPKSTTGFFGRLFGREK